MDERPELTAAERAELELLRAELAALRARQPAASTGTRGAGRWRTIVAVLLIVLAGVLAPPSVLAVWANTQVTDTERYIRTVEPLARDPAIQRAVTDGITAQVFAHLDIQAPTRSAP